MSLAHHDQANHGSPPQPLPQGEDDTNSINTISSTPQNPQEGQEELTQVMSKASHTHDAPMTQYTSHVEIPDAVYERFSHGRKVGMVALLSFCAFLAPISSTAILAAIPEVAATYNTTGSIIDISNAMYMLFMGFSPMLWGPLSQVYGRRPVCLITALLFCACSAGTAAAPNLAAYYIFRILTAFEGTAFLIVGSSCIGDIYRPTERATAMGWFFSGTLVGPAFGPFIGGIIVTYVSWRVIFWLQTALAGVALIGAFLLLPETIHHRKADELIGLPRKQKATILFHMINPWRVLKLYRYPNLIFTGLCSSALVWNMYSLLTPIRYVLNPRFNLTTPMQSGLFYLAPGCGYILGTFFGGRYADHIVKNFIIKRNGTRIAEDRLRSAVPFVGLIIPACMLIYGWSVEKAVGGIPLPVICMFIQGVAQLFCFPSLNTYCLDVMQSKSAESIAGNYVFRYMFAAAGTAVVLPAVERIGVGWFSTISAGFLVVSTVGLCAAIRWGKGWRDEIGRKQWEKKMWKREDQGVRERELKVDGVGGNEKTGVAEKVVGEGRPNDEEKQAV